MKNVRESNGITLIALVITVIVLLILAGVTIAALTGDNGILAQTAKAKEESEKAEIIEQIQLDIADKQIENLGSINEEEFYEILGKYGTVSADETILTTTKGNYEILISDIYNGNIETSLVTTPIESWEYTLNDENKTITLTKYVGEETKISIPAMFTINSQSYTTILSRSTTDSGPFVSNTIIKRVKFDENIYLADKYSAQVLFFNCSNLERVDNLPLKIYGGDESVTSLANMFNGCSLLTRAPKIPEGIINIQGMFTNCTSLENSPEIPSTVENMTYTYQNCSALTGIININSDNVSQAERCFFNDKLEIRLRVNENTTTYTTFEALLDTWSNVEFYYETNMTIACWGDSLTVGSNGDGITYPKILSRLVKTANVVNLGVGGEGSTKIAMRQGAIPLYAEGFTIPEEKIYTEINLIDENNNKVIIGQQGTAGLNPCYINGVEGDIIYHEGSSKTFFIRRESGQETVVDNKTRVITEGMKEYQNADILIIWSGTNDTPDASSVSNVIDNIDAMINYSNNDKYVIIGLTSKYYMPEIEEVNQMLASKYGEHFLDIRKYILENGLSDAGISATAQDLEDIENGEIPTSLRADKVHFSESGYRIIGQQVYNKLISLGYISE